MLMYEPLFVLITTLGKLTQFVLLWAESSCELIPFLTERHEVNPRKGKKESVRADSGTDAGFSWYVLRIWVFDVIIKLWILYLLISF